MDVTKSNLLIFGGSFALCGILILSVLAKWRCRKSTDKRSDSSVVESLRESKIALDKAALVIQGALDGMERGVSGDGN